MWLILENVRSLVGRHEIEIRPLTLLTGENSTGKSTLLAGLAATCDPDGFPFWPSFNRAPYSLGNFDTIATFKGGRFGRAKHFTIGYRLDDPQPHIAPAVEATFRGRSGQVELASIAIVNTPRRVDVSIDESTELEYKGRIDLKTPEGDQTFPFALRSRLGIERPLSFQDLLLALPGLDSPDFNARVDFFNRVSQLGLRLLPFTAASIAPIRTKPERTYGEVAEAFAPGGDHVPFLLERLFRERASASETKALITALEEFGKDSGLFKDISVRQLGTKAGDPFQLLVEVGGPAANLIDVGYGVSQSLPVIVQSVLAAPQSLLLMQQPEVHLHPRAQAALGSFFARLVAANRKRFVIETHSDYIIDRIRQRVAAGALKPESVGILYFERDGIETNIHQLSLDNDGNVRGAPQGYRGFFLKEELNLLGRGDS